MSTFGPWQTVYGYFNRWRQNGLLAVLEALIRQQRNKVARRRLRPVVSTHSVFQGLP